MSHEFVSLFSGIDSFVATHLYKQSGKECVGIFLEYDQNHQEVLLVENMASRLDINLEVAKIDVEMLQFKNLPFYPFRNAIFISTVANWMIARTNARVLVTGLGTISINESVYYPDTSLDFVNKLQLVLNTGMPKDLKIEVINPVNGWHKKDIFNWLYENGYEDIIKKSSSCYEMYENGFKEFPWGMGCGICPHCNARQQDYEQSIPYLKQNQIL